MRRVYFHLAENKADSVQPFIFAATVTTGLTIYGRPVHRQLSEALVDYHKAGDEIALLCLLAPVVRAAHSVGWVKRLLDSKHIFCQFTPFGPTEAYRFLKDVPMLEEAGLWTSIPGWWRKRPLAGIKIVLETGESETELNYASQLSLDCRLVLGDEELTEAELEKLLAGQDSLAFFKGRWVEVDRERLNKAQELSKSIEKGRRGLEGEISTWRVSRLLAGDWPGDEKPGGDGLLNLKAGKRLAEFLKGAGGAAVRGSDPWGLPPASPNF